MAEEAARLAEVCEGLGLPVDVDALVEHVKNNARLCAALDMRAEQAHRLQHVGWLDTQDRLWTRRYEKHQSVEGMVPVFTHDDWQGAVPFTERNAVGRVTEATAPSREER